MEERSVLSTSLPDRRTLLKRSLAAGGAFAASSLLGNFFIPSIRADESPVVETEGGKVHGAAINGIQSFKGIPYGASTEGAARFMPPQKAKPWSGVRDALHVGLSCPQLPRGKNPDILKMVYSGLYEHAPQYGEDCLVLNVWTPAAGDAGKRPVMFYCHGGAYLGGSGGGPWYDGTNLAREGDVVVVTVNHRVNLFGFLYLGDLGGEKYADSGNVSMLDLILALHWVRDNISQFGGNPDNVTIFGESGGGSKVSVLVAMPPAAGLFHKAIVQSGSALRARTRDDATKATHAVLANLGLGAGQLDQLHSLPTDRLLAASAAGGGFGPVVDGRSLPGNPFDPKAPDVSADVPMIIGTTKEETVLLIGDGDSSTFSLDETSLRQRLAKYTGGNTDAVDRLIAVYRKALPNAAPSDLFFEITTGLGTRKSAITQAERKTEQGTAPAYMYLFAWQSLGFGGKYKSLHGSDVPFAFDNVDKAAVLTDNHAECQQLAQKMSRAWIAFARSGNPNHDGIPKWNPYSLNERATMIFDNKCAAVNDPFKEERLAVASV